MDALHAMPRFVNFGLQTPEIHAPLYCSKKVIGSDNVLFLFARWQHCWYCCTVGVDI